MFPWRGWSRCGRQRRIRELESLHCLYLPLQVGKPLIHLVVFQRPGPALMSRVPFGSLPVAGEGGCRTWIGVGSLLRCVLNSFDGAGAPPLGWRKQMDEDVHHVSEVIHIPISVAHKNGVHKARKGTIK